MDDRPTSGRPSGTLPGAPTSSDEPDWIVYVDLDAYYVSCELRERPDLAGRMVVVGPPPGVGPSRGVVLSASYDARALGVRSAMPVGAAARLAPQAIWIPPDFSKYERVAKEVRTLLARFSADVEPLSIDEAAVRIGPGPAERAHALAERIQTALREELRLPASLGVATTRVVAKIATDRAKPGGIVVVAPDEVAAFLAPLPVRAIPGVGPKTEARLTDAGYATIGDLAVPRPAELSKVVGSFARELSALARGTPKESSGSYSGPRARSTDRTFERDATSWEELAPALAQLASELGETLSADGWRYGSAGVAFRWGDFSRSAHSRALPAVSEGPEPLREWALRLGHELWDRATAEAPRAVRTVSVRVERLAHRSQRQVSLDDFSTQRDTAPPSSSTG
jgi:nucleotidyltransferase/DNA polymerase involved in DNA repair